MFTKMFTRTIIFCLLAVFFSASNMLYTEAWESAEADKRCEKERDVGWDPHACGRFGETECAGSDVEFKADPGPCIGNYPGWECDQNGPTKEYSVGKITCNWITPKLPKKPFCKGYDVDLPDVKDVPACRDRKKP